MFISNEPAEKRRFIYSTKNQESYESIASASGVGEAIAVIALNDLGRAMFIDYNLERAKKYRSVRRPQSFSCRVHHAGKQRWSMNWLNIMLT
jgi:hypothetical protein